MNNITPLQRQLLERLQVIDPEVAIQWDETRGVAGSIRFRRRLYTSADMVERIDQSFLSEYGMLLGPQDLLQSITQLRSYEDDLQWLHLIYAFMVRQEFELYGSKIAAHFDSDGLLVEIQSSLWRDIQVELTPKITRDQLYEILLKRISGIEGFDDVRSRVMEKEKDFPILDEPRLVVYPRQEKLHLAWLTYGYGDTNEMAGAQAKGPFITYGQMFIDADNGERLLFAPTLITAETATQGSGLAVTPITGTQTTRSLEIVRIDNTTTYRLKNTTESRDIVTYDAACSTSYNSNSEIGSAINNGTLPFSEDTDGNHNWDRLPSNTTAAQRTAGQQPEVDAHYFVSKQYEWYKAISSRVGWDDGNYNDPPVPDQSLNIVAHCYPPAAWFSNCQINNAYQWNRKSGGTWVFWLAFMDGDTVNYTYPSGSHFLVAHEYQHAITNFSFQDANGDPGLTYSGWLGAVHEGLSDVFGILSTEQWEPGTDISPATPPLIFRNLAYPRDTGAYDSGKLDHFDDRNNATNLGTGEYYDHGTILAHCAYLIGKGGVHERATRNPQLIPVYSLGRETVNGINLPKAARVWYRALTTYSNTLGALTGNLVADQSSFRTLRDGCVNSAEDLFGTGSLEQCNTILAFYAAGLHTDGVDYGADVTFLRWGIAWDLSRSYVGLNSPDYASLDLFINNNGTSEWNAIINVIDPSTNIPTDYENMIYCRVRNVGDKDALNVEVEFDYTKIGTATVNWQPVLDKNGVPQKLNLGTLGAGQSNFPDSDQNSPPAAARVKWCIPPLAAGENVHHFCLRAKVKASNDVNPHNNDVQSNIVYSDYSPPTPAGVKILAGNPNLEKSIPVDLRINAQLPEDWEIRIKGIKEGDRLKPGEERLFEVVINVPIQEEEELTAPLDGDFRGELLGETKIAFDGSLTKTVMEGKKLRGRFSTLLPKIGTVSGPFEGTINLRTGWVKGFLLTTPKRAGSKPIEQEFRGRLRPWRRAEVSQWAGEEHIGGVSIQLQVPWRRGRFSHKLPPTKTQWNIQR